MILGQAYTSRNLSVYNQVKSRPIYLSSYLGATGLYIKGLCHLVNAMIVKTNVRIKNKS